MTEERLPTELLISSRIRLAALDGVPIMILHKGDPSTGGIMLKINLCDRTGFLLSQTRFGDKLVWTACGSESPQAEHELDTALDREIQNDPDLWVLEIEDKKGRHWFPGNIMSFEEMTSGC